MQSQRLLYQDNYGSLKSTALIEFVTPNELLSLFELIAPQFNATSELLINNRGNPYIVFNLNKEHRVVIKSINPRWSEEMASDKFVLLTRICEKGLLTFKDINALNRDNVDVKFTAYTPKGEKETYLGVDKLMGLAGGVTVQSIIMIVNEFIFTQKTLQLAFKHNNNVSSDDKNTKSPKDIH